jgi:hypothetical protein
MPKHWTSDEQKMWLESMIGEYLAAQKKGRLMRFFAGLNESFFEKWPERQATFPSPPGIPAIPLSPGQNIVLQAAIATRKGVSDVELLRLKFLTFWGGWQQLRSWMIRNGNPAGGRKKRSCVSMFASKVKSRQPQAVEVYQRLYYATKILPEISLRLRDKPKLTKGERLAFQREVANELYENETEEIKAEVLAEMEDAKLKMELKAVAEEEESRLGPAGGGKTPKEYQRYVL